MEIFVDGSDLVLKVKYQTVSQLNGMLLNKNEIHEFDVYYNYNDCFIDWYDVMEDSIKFIISRPSYENMFGDIIKPSCCVEIYAETTKESDILCGMAWYSRKLGWQESIIFIDR